MPLTVVVRSHGASALRSHEATEPPSLTFDGARVAIGRGAGCDVRLPDPTVSHRHASIRADAGVYSVIDEGSTNGTFVGKTRLSPRAPRTLQSGDLLRVGNVWLEIRLDQRPETRDLSQASRELALAMVTRALEARGEATHGRIVVVEGPDAGASLPLLEEGRIYSIGHDERCALKFDEPTPEPFVLQVVRRRGLVAVRDLGPEARAFLGETPLSPGADAHWKPGVTLQIGHTALTLNEPVVEALTELEAAPDEKLEPDRAPSPPTLEEDAPPEPETTAPDEAEPAAPEAPAAPPSKRPPRATLATSQWVGVLVAVTVILASLSGLFWLLR